MSDTLRAYLKRNDLLEIKGDSPANNVNMQTSFAEPRRSISPKSSTFSVPSHNIAPVYGDKNESASDANQPRT